LPSGPASEREAPAALGIHVRSAFFSLDLTVKVTFGGVGVRHGNLPYKSA
jgi:hypothetical protein